MFKVLGRLLFNRSNDVTLVMNIKTVEDYAGEKIGNLAKYFWDTLGVRREMNAAKAQKLDIVLRDKQSGAEWLYDPETGKTSPITGANPPKLPMRHRPDGTTLH